MSAFLPLHKGASWPVEPHWALWRHSGVCVGAVYEVNWVRSSGANMSLCAEHWVYGQDIGTVTQGLPPT